MSIELAGVPAVDVLRGERVESIHEVAAALSASDGRIIYHQGTIDVPVFLRSAAKPFIAAAAVRAGVVERFGLAPYEIAIMSASHHDEPEHRAAAASVLAKIGASESDLQCGGDPSALHNNCSGKHAGILALATLRGESFAGYLAAEHPVEREILAFCERVFGETFGPDRLAEDGCGIPVFATSLRNAARGFARFATLRDLDAADRAALRVVRDAMTAHPWMISGTGRFDSELMEHTGGAIAAKGGAEGVHASALIAHGTGLVLKVIDGAQRAVPPAAIALLRGCGALDDAAYARLAAHAQPALRNVAGRVVGQLRPRSVDVF